MIRTTGLKTEYSPITKIGNGVYQISWDYKDVFEPVYEELTEEQKALEKAGEIVERTKIGEEDTDYCTYVYEYIYYKPSIDNIKQIIYNWYNKQVDEKILSGFVWNNMQIWLSPENQFNYKAAYDLAIQTQGATLPVTFKFGDAYSPIYYTFSTMEDFTNFYISTIEYINTMLAEGWQKKDSIDWSSYVID